LSLNYCSKSRRYLAALYSFHCDIWDEQSSSGIKSRAKLCERKKQLKKHFKIWVALC